MSKTPVYLNPKKNIEERVNDLLRRMTVDEKIDQIVSSDTNVIDKLYDLAEKGEMPNVSCTFVYFGLDVEKYDKIQKYQIEHSRLKIPFILACEDTHGVSNPLCTIFPTTGCMAATFDEKLVGKCADISAKEARILGITQVYAPNIDISWDLRWGRVEENFGEDPYLTSKMACEIIKNYQKNGVAATIKHYIAYGLGESGLNLAPAHIGERDIREYMLPPFRDCIKKAKAWSIMPSYNEIDGEPVHASEFWMQDVLRKELGFDGMAVTDYEASNFFDVLHRIVEKPVDAGKILCDNRVGLEAELPFGYNGEFRELVKSGKYPISKVNECVKDVLRLKFRLGLFENPYSQIEKMGEIHGKKGIALAKEIAEKGTVLLKNDGVLPLKENKKVAIIGPNGNLSQLGDYIYYGYFDPEYKGKCVAEESLSLEQVFNKNGVSYEFCKGSEFSKTDDKMLLDAYNVAKNSDAVILCLGDNSKGGQCCGNQEDLKRLGVGEVAVTIGEGYDLNSIELTPAQEKLFDKVAEAGKPIIMILYGGRPLAITRQLDRCSAVLFAFGVGEQGNEALFDILYGKVNPSGKLPLSFPRSTGHIPCFYNHKPSARGGFYKIRGTYDNPGRDYVFDTPDPLFPFGFGLSYTEFSYGDIKTEQLGKTKFKVSVDVKNTGKFDGDESVLLFLSCRVSRITPVVKKLRAFRRISLKKGESATVSFVLNREDFTYIDRKMKRSVAKGKYDIIIGDKTTEITVG